jgi:hypothetical protein
VNYFLVLGMVFGLAAVQAAARLQAAASQASSTAIVAGSSSPA